jgi:oligopeptide/dipeptide ABC transporter ATP-binding protein
MNDFQPLIQVNNLTVKLGRGSNSVTAVDDVSLVVFPSEVVGLVGESGCGKSSLAKAIVKLIATHSGELYYKDLNVTNLSERKFRKIRKNLQLVLQDPYSALDPTKKIKSILKEPLKIHKIVPRNQRDDLIKDVLSQVGLTEAHLNSRPFELSGGQCQRVNIARALILSPELIICDEIVSALDVSIQAQILNLLKDLKVARNLSLLFIAHDISVVSYLSDYLLVMYLGKIVEQGPTKEVINSPKHHYSFLLTDSALNSHFSNLSQQSEVKPTEVPSLRSIPTGCRFHPRCPAATEICKEVEPPLEKIGLRHYVACHHPRTITVKNQSASENY